MSKCIRVMKAVNLKALAFAVLALSALTVAPQAGAELSLTIRATKDQFLIGEHFYLVYEIQNPDNSDRIILPRFDDYEHFRLEISVNGGEPRLFEPWLIPEYAAPTDDIVVLAAGEKYSGLFDATFEKRLENLFLSVPGEYSIRARYRIPEGMVGGPLEVWSEPISFIVSEPQGTNKLAYDLLMEGAGRIGRGIWTLKTEQAEYYERLIDEYHESEYALYASYQLGVLYSYHAITDWQNTDQAGPALERCAELQTGVFHDDRNAPLSLLAGRYWALSHARLGNTDLAVQVLGQIFTSSEATSQEMTLAIKTIALVESGYYRKQSPGAALEVNKAKPAGSQVPLRSFAQALGFSVEWDSPSRQVRLRSSDVEARLSPGGDRLVLNGRELGPFKSSLRNGATCVSPSAVSELIAEGRRVTVARALSRLSAALPEKPDDH